MEDYFEKLLIKKYPRKVQSVENFSWNENQIDLISDKDIQKAVTAMKKNWWDQMKNQQKCEKRQGIKVQG